MNRKKSSNNNYTHNMHDKGPQSYKTLKCEEEKDVRIPLERVNELTPAERLQGLYDVHGVPTLFSETSEMVCVLLHQLEVAVTNLREPKEPMCAQRRWT